VQTQQDFLEDSQSQGRRGEALAGWMMPLPDTIGELRRRRGCGTVAMKLLPALGGAASPGQQ